MDLIHPLLTRWDLSYLWKPRWDADKPKKSLEDFLNNYGFRGKTAIEFGCGTGTNILFLGEKGFEVTGVDISWIALLKAKIKAKKKKLKLKLIRGDVTKFVSKDKYDLVIDIGCLHTIDECKREKYFQTLDNTLGQNGIFFIHFFEKLTDQPSKELKGLTKQEIISLIGNHYKLVWEKKYTTEYHRPVIALAFQKQKPEPTIIT